MKQPTHYIVKDWKVNSGQAWPINPLPEPKYWQDNDYKEEYRLFQLFVEDNISNTDLPDGIYSACDVETYWQYINPSFDNKWINLSSHPKTFEDDTTYRLILRLKQQEGEKTQGALKELAKNFEPLPEDVLNDLIATTFPAIDRTFTLSEVHCICEAVLKEADTKVAYASSPKLILSVNYKQIVDEYVKAK